MGSAWSKIRKDVNRSHLKKKETLSLAEKADSMQMVSDHIYMGSELASKDRRLLKANKITHILAIGWNLEKTYPQDFEYLLLNNVEDRPEFILIDLFKECFTYMDDCLIQNKGNLLVHCHKGLSRSASIIIAYIMYKKKRSFVNVLQEIRESRSFIMPNIGFQVQLQAFEDKNYSLNKKDYQDINVMDRISKKLPEMLENIKKYEELFIDNKGDTVSNELFEFTMYFHQVQRLYIDGKLDETNELLLHEAIKRLRRIQVDFIKIPVSLKRFDKMFTITSQQQTKIEQRKSRKKRQQQPSLSLAQKTSQPFQEEAETKEEKVNNNSIIEQVEKENKQEIAELLSNMSPRQQTKDTISSPRASYVEEPLDQILGGPITESEENLFSKKDQLSQLNEKAENIPAY